MFLGCLVIAGSLKQHISDFYRFTLHFCDFDCYARDDLLWVLVGYPITPTTNPITPATMSFGLQHEINGIKSSVSKALQVGAGFLFVEVEGWYLPPYKV